MRISKEDAGLIVQEYRLAKDQEEQISILAELYGTDTSDIRGILYRAGAYQIGREQICRALEILKQGGKNHTLGTLRLWMACFKDCGTKRAKRILLDYRQRPWEEPVPEEDFVAALHIEKRERRNDSMAAEKKNEQKTAFSAEERNIIIYGLTRTYAEKDKELQELKIKTEEKRIIAEAAEQEYNEAKEREDAVAAALGRMEALIGRIQEDGQEPAEESVEQLWAELSGGK